MSHMSYNDAFYNGLEFKRKLGLYVKCMKEDLGGMVTLPDLRFHFAKFEVLPRNGPI